MKAQQISVRDLVEKLNDHIGKNNFAFFLGAGASKSAEIPIASEMINEWILKIAGKQKVAGLGDPYTDPTKQTLKKGIIAWAEKYKTKENPKASDYGFWFEKAYPIKQERQEYIEDKIDRAKPLTPEYYLFTQLIEKGISNLIVTLNFDDLVAEALRFCNQKPPLVIYDELFMWNARIRSLTKRPLVLKIHGDFMFSTMQNLDDETEKLLPNTLSKIEGFFQEYGLIVIGYGGNDHSIMKTFTDIAGKTGGFPYGIYWCTYGSKLPPLTTKIIETNKDFFHIPNVDFLQFMLECQAVMNLDDIEKLSEKIQKKIDEVKASLKSQSAAKRVLLSEDSNNIEELKKNAGLAYLENNYETTLNYLQRLNELNVKDASIYFLWGNILYDMLKFKQAIEKYQLAIEIKPDFAEAYNNWGLTLDNLGKHDEGILKFQKAIELKLDYADAYYNWGFILTKLGKNDESILKYKKAIELKQDNPDAYNNWGVALDNLKKYDEAILKYQKAIELKPGYADAYYNWGSALDHLEKHDEAILKYQKAIELKPDNPNAYINWGVALEKLKRFDEGIKKYQKVVELKPDYALAYFNWGIILTKLEKYDEAIIKYQKAIELKPDYADVYYNWGVALYSLGNQQEAIEKYQKAIELKPNYPSAIYNISCSYSLLGDIPEVLNYLEKACHIDSKYKSQAKSDKDFKALWNNREFKRITKE